jgi:class 3 adenylate cyclase
MFNESILQKKIQGLLQYPSLNQTTVQKIGDILKTLDDWHLFRMNPFRFANQHDLNEQEVVDIFVHGAKIGLLDFSYNMLCPVCHGIVHHHESLADVEEEGFYCGICDINVPTHLDEQVEVSFTIPPSIKTLTINPYSDLQAYTRYYFSENYQDSPELAKALKELILQDFFVLAPDERKTFTLNLAPEQFYQFTSLENNASVFINVTSNVEIPSQTIDIDLLPCAFSPSTLQLPPNDYQFRMTNQTNNTLGGFIMTFSQVNKQKFKEIKLKYPSTATPFLSAKMLLNQQSFRELFRVQNLPETLNLSIKNLTIMFTDLRGSTEMYDKAGDVFAYQLVKAHFKTLTEVVRQFSGAVVKTMGDAIMATFSHPLDGFLASLNMLSQIEQLNETWKDKGYQIGLKVGLNEGPALAVINDERFDYFGQSVNIAARVQGLAQAGEIWVTQSILDSQEVTDKLSASGYQTEQHSINLKGIGQPTIVHKIFKPL